MKPKFGEIWLADLGWAGKTRPVLVFSRDDPDPPRVLFIYIPLTRQNRNSLYEIPLGHIPFLNKESVANVQGIGSLPRSRFERKLGALPQIDIGKIKDALMFACNLR